MVSSKVATQTAELVCSRSSRPAFSAAKPEGGEAHLAEPHLSYKLSLSFTVNDCILDSKYSLRQILQPQQTTDAHRDPRDNIEHPTTTKHGDRRERAGVVCLFFAYLQKALAFTLGIYPRIKHDTHDWS